MVRVREGETVIIAGLMQDRTAADANTAGPRGGAPRSEARTTRKTDLVILLTPTVMTRDEITAGAAADRQQADDGQRKPVRQ
jgi:type II secretory pathway component GspD/PulD (secretin)